MQELGDVVAQHRSSGGEHLVVDNADGATQPLEDFFLKVLILPLDQGGSLLAESGIFQVPCLAHADGLLDHHAHHGLGVGQVVIDGGIDLLPEAGHAAHIVGLHILNGTLYLLGIIVDGYTDAGVETHHRPT